MKHKPLLEVRDLRVTFTTDDDRTVRAVDGVSFDLVRGETLAIVGESGSGKSATALALMGLSASNARVSGSIRLGDSEMTGLPDSAWRKIRGRRIAMIFQDPLSALNPVLTVRRQLTEVLQAHTSLRGSAARARALELLQHVGIPDAPARLRAYPHELSGGMRQRVMIAIAIACNPEILVADEPTTALDSTIQAQILELLRRLARERDMALVLITHDLGVVAETADRVAVMYGGRIVETCQAADLFVAGRHRYTEGLLNAIPRMDTSRAGRLTPIPGSAFERVAWENGCAFANRCAHVIAQCLTPNLSLEPIAVDHEVRCENPVPAGASA